MSRLGRLAVLVAACVTLLAARPALAADYVIKLKGDPRGILRVLPNPAGRKIPSSAGLLSKTRRARST
jgi:hypothetical protein